MFNIILGVLFISSMFTLIFMLTAVLLDISGIVKNQLIIDKMFNIANKLALFHMLVLIILLTILVALAGYSLIKGGI